MESNSPLYQPLTIRGLEIRNRFIMAPMCQYSAVDGLIQPWHRQHYGERAQGGVGLMIIEATAVQARGRISPADLGIWNDAQRDAFVPIVEAAHAAGTKIGVQLAHAGRKGSTHVPWQGSGQVPVTQGGWITVSSGPAAFDPTYPVPEQLDADGIRGVIADFASAARRAVEAGFDTVEIHAAHGYLLHQFLSPLTNHRTDAYGGSQENRFRIVLEVARAIRKVVPEAMPVLVRVSGTDWVEGGWSIEATIELLIQLSKEGVDLADISSGGLIPGVKIPVGPGYQVPLAERVKRETGMLTTAVGLITDIEQAEGILAEHQADAVTLGRVLLRDPYFPLKHAPKDHRKVPVQYERAF